MRFTEKYVKKIMNKGQDNSIQVWGCINYYEGTGSLTKYEGRLNGQRYEKEIIEDSLIPYLKSCGYANNNCFFMQDNAPCHKQNLFHQKFLEEHNILLFSDWPANSPYINPIENLWAFIEKKTLLRNPKTKFEFWKFLQEEWTNIPLDFIQLLINSLPERICAVKKSKGGYTKY